MACGALLRSSTIDCANPILGGVASGARLILINKNDISSYTATGSDIISAFTLASGASAFQFEGIKQSLKPKFERIQSPSSQNVYKHTVEFLYFDYSQNAKNNIARMAQGEYIAIYENNGADANAFEVLGLNAGMEVVELMRSPQENGAAVKIVLATGDGDFENKPPQTFFATSYANSLSLLNGYLYIPTATTVSPAAAAAAGGTALTFTGTNFYGSGTNSAVVQVDYVNQVTGAVVNQPTHTVVSATSITATSVAMAAGTYKVRITTLKGAAESTTNLIVA